MTTNTEAKTGTKTKPGRKAGAPPKEWDYTGLDATFLAEAEEVSTELGSLAAPTRARDERQVAIDKVVIQLHRTWVDQGRPDRWATMPKKSYHVDPKAADTLRMLVRRAANFIGASARFGGSVRDQQGREIVVFAIRDPRVKAEKGKDTWTLSELREFVTEFYGDDTESATEFLGELTGENAPESETDESGASEGERESES